MIRSQIDWDAHVAAYKASGKSLAEYCKVAGVKITTLRHRIYKGRQKAKTKRTAHFHQVVVASELTITRMPTGELSLRGFDVTDLATLVKAWSHALQG